MAFQVQTDRINPSLLSVVTEIAHTLPGQNLDDKGQAEQIKLLAKMCLELNAYCTTLEKSLRGLAEKTT